jgi:hypothetical protein
VTRVVTQLVDHVVDHVSDHIAVEEFGQTACLLVERAGGSALGWRLGWWWLLRLLRCRRLR